MPSGYYDHPKRHGGVGLKSYDSWKHMIKRCTDPLSKDWARYGGRGVKVCERWLNSYPAFRDDMGEPPAGLTLDKDKIGDGMLYSPETCCWLSRKEQNRNTRRTIHITHNEQTMCIADWAEQVGLKPGTLAYRIRSGWPIDQALERDLLPGKAH